MKLEILKLPISQDKDISMKRGCDNNSEEPASKYRLDKNPFLDPEVLEHWRAVYKSAQYEYRHFFDPTLTWSKEEEKHLVCK